MRVGAALGLLSAASVPVLVWLLPWGHVYTLIDVLPPHTLVQTLHGSDLPRGFQIELIALSGVVAAIAVIAILRSIHPAVLLLCAAAMAAEIVLINIESGHHFFSSAPASLAIARVSWTSVSATLIAAFVMSGLGLAAWLGMFVVASASGTECPDCAEQVRRGVIDCPHCGYKFPLPGHLRRCEACQRLVKAQARVCRHCHHRFGDPVER